MGADEATPENRAVWDRIGCLLATVQRAKVPAGGLFAPGGEKIDPAGRGGREFGVGGCAGESLGSRTSVPAGGCGSAVSSRWHLCAFFDGVAGGATSQSPGDRLKPATG